MTSMVSVTVAGGDPVPPGPPVGTVEMVPMSSVPEDLVAVAVPIVTEDPPPLPGERPLLTGVREEWDAAAYADVTLVCGPPTVLEDGEEQMQREEQQGAAPSHKTVLKAHRLVLATLSHLLGQALLSDVLCCPCDEDSVILLPDLDEEDAQLLRDFLEQAYKGGYQEVRVPQALEFLGLAEQMVCFRPPVAPRQLVLSEDQQQATMEQGELEPSQYAVQTDQGLKFLDDPALDPDTVAAATALLKRKVKLQMTPTVQEREERILAERSANPINAEERAKCRRAKPGTSQIWHFYRRTRDKKHAVCKECDKKFRSVAGGTTSTLLRHLKGTHPELHEEFLIMNNSDETRDERVQAEVVEDEELNALEDKPRVFAKRSPIWKHFEAGSSEKAKCAHCSQEVSTANGATVYLNRHLDSEHPEILKEIRSELEEKKKKQQEAEDEAAKKAVISIETVDAKNSPIWLHFEQENLQKIRCLVCKQTVRTLEGNTSSALKHLRRRHPELVDKENSVKLTDYLLQEASSKKRIKSFKTPASSGKKRAAIWNYFDSTEDKVVHSCKACGTNLSCKKKNASNLGRHLRVVHERLYRQYLLDSGFKEEELDELIAKQSVKRGPKSTSTLDIKQRTCSDCGKEYSTRKGMLVHQMAVHSGARPFVCQECGMSFARKESFKRHNHSGEKPFLCSVCGKTFARRHIRDIHEKAHFGEKRYGCTFCEKRFTTNQKKMIHERIHTGEKPYECKECGKKFVQMHQLQTHTRIHTGARPFRCDNCNQMFRHLSTRAKHNCPARPSRPLGMAVPATTFVQDPIQTTTIMAGAAAEEEEETQQIEVYDENGIQVCKEEALVIA